jgi:hypothetical protein
MIGCPPGTPDKVFPRGGDGSSLLTPTLLRARLSEHPAGFQDGRRRDAFDSLARPVSPVCQVADKGDFGARQRPARRARRSSASPERAPGSHHHTLKGSRQHPNRQRQESIRRSPDHKGAQPPVPLTSTAPRPALAGLDPDRRDQEVGDTSVLHREHSHAPTRPQRGARGATFSPGRFRHRGTFSLNVEGGPSPRRAHGEGRAMGAEAVPLKLPEGPSSLLKW